jgi:hypothetical protein
VRNTPAASSQRPWKRPPVAHSQPPHAQGSGLKPTRHTAVAGLRIVSAGSVTRVSHAGHPPAANARAAASVLACFRPDGTMLEALDDIAEDEEDAALHPTAISGHVPYSWLEPRTAAAAQLTGSFCAVTTAVSIAALRPTFISQALRLGLGDFDASALKDGRPRILTQSGATHLYATTDVDGVTFTSRHGDDLELWAIFERPGDPPTSPRLGLLGTHPLSPENPDLLAVFEQFGLVGTPAVNRPPARALPSRSC